MEISWTDQFIDAYVSIVKMRFEWFLMAALCFIIGSIIIWVIKNWHTEKKSVPRQRTLDSQCCFGVIVLYVNLDNEPASAYYNFPSQFVEKFDIKDVKIFEMCFLNGYEMPFRTIEECFAAFSVKEEANGI